MGSPILKTKEELEAMRPAGEATARCLKLLEEIVAPGVTTLEMDRAVEDVIRGAGGIPAFLGYPCAKPGGIDYPGSICASINEEVVHGIPSDERVLKEGDIVSVDVGVELNGWFGDAARTYAVGDISRKTQKLLDVTRASLNAGIHAMRPGVELRCVCKAVQDCAEGSGFSVVRDFVGHGIGRSMHEPPQVPNYVSRMFTEGRQKLHPGAVLAIEPMVNLGGSAVRVAKDGWTVVTKDRSLSAHFENSVALTEDGPVVLTEY